MSTTIDERIVSMQFDNKKFESNVKTSLSTLEKLKQSLNLTEAGKGLEEVARASKKVDMNPLTNAVDSMKVKFSALQVVAVTALANITNQAVNVGKRVTSALTIDPVKTGFQEYETQINAIQTILANTQSKGTNLQQVIKALDELNHYADMTIYNFTEMTRNIGTFTAAGIGLETSVSAIKGIANLAAVSGSTSQQASTAMYQLSQALAAGTVKLMDWNSVVNAGMGGQVFQDSLKETARVHGIAIDQMIEDEGSFRETLQNGWLTSDILTETLAKFTGDLNESQLRTMGYTEEQIAGIIKMGQTANDAATKVKTFTQLFDTLKEAVQSGWTKSWELIIGDFEEAKELLTSISDAIGGAIGKQADVRNKMLQEWKDEDGRTALIDSFKNAFEGLGSVIKPVSEAFREIFPRTTGKQLADITKALRDFTSHLKLSDKQSAKLKTTFKGLFSVLDMLKNAFLTIAEPALNIMVTVLTTLFDALLDIGSALGSFVEGMNKATEKTNMFIGVANSLIKIVIGMSNVIKIVFSGLFDIIGGTGGTLVKILDYIGESLSKISLNDIGGIINVVSMGGIGYGLNKIFQNIAKPLQVFNDTIGQTLGNTTSLLDDLRGCLVAYQDQLKASSLKHIATAIAILSGSLMILSLIDPNKLSTAIVSISTLFAELIFSMQMFTKINKLQTGAAKSISVMIGMSTSILILASAMKSISMLKIEEIVSGITGLGLMGGVLLGFITVLDKCKLSIPKGTANLIVLASALKIMVSVCKDFAQMNFEELGKGLLGVGILLVSISKFLGKTMMNGELIKTAIGLLVLSSSLKVLASVAKTFSTLDLLSLGKELGGIAILLFEMTVFTNRIPTTVNMVSTGIALIAIAMAIKALSLAVKEFGVLNIDKMIMGLSTMALSLIELVVVMKFIPTNDIVSMGAGLILISTSLNILSKSLQKMSNLSVGGATTAVIAMGASLTVLAVALHYMQGTIGGTTALLLAAGAIGVLTVELRALGTMNLSSLLISLGAIAGVFGIIVGLGALLSKSAVGILALSGALIALAGSTVLFGTGITLIGGGLLLAAEAINSILNSVIKSVDGVIEIFKVLIKSIGDIVIEISNVVIKSAPKMGEAFVALIVMAANSIGATVPLLAETFIKVIAQVISSMKEHIGQIASDIFDILISVLNVLVDKIPELVNVGVKIFTKFFSSLGKALNELSAYELNTLMSSINLLSDVLLKLSASMFIMKSMPLTGVVKSLGVLAVVISGITAMLTALGAVSQIPGVMWFVEKGGVLLSKIGYAIGSFVGSVIGGLSTGMSSGLPELGKNLSNFMSNIQSFVDGASKINNSTIAGIKTLAETILILTASNIIQSISSWLVGGPSFDQFAENISFLGEGLANFSNSIGQNKIDANEIQNVANSVKVLSEISNSMPKTGGIWQKLAGGIDIGSFGNSLKALGNGIAGFAKATKNVKSDAVNSVANAGKVLVSLSKSIPKSDGIFQIITGTTDIDNFGKALKTLGRGIANFGKEVKNVKPDVVKAASDAGKMLTSLAKSIPQSGGLFEYVTGGINIEGFGKSLKLLGKGIADFGKETKDIKSEQLASATNAGKMITSLTKSIPKSGGLFDFFTGHTDIVLFSYQLKNLGSGIKDFSIEVKDFDTSNVEAASNAGKALASLAKNLPSSGGLFSIFTGSVDIYGFASKLKLLGEGLADFSKAVSGKINADDAATAANVGSMLSSLAGSLPSDGGLFEMFTGSKDINEFAENLSVLGEGLAKFSEEVSGKIDSEDATTAANFAGVLSQLIAVIPKSGKFINAITGYQDLEGFSKKLPLLGEGLAKFSNSVAGKINNDNASSITNIANMISPLVDNIDKTGGLINLITGAKNLPKFASDLPLLGKGLAGFSEAVAGKIDTDSVNAASNVGTALASIYESLEDSGGFFSFFTGNKESLLDFGDSLNGFGKSIADFSNSVKDIKTDTMNSAVKLVNKIATLATDLTTEEFDAKSLDTMSIGLRTLGGAYAVFGISMGLINPEIIQNAVSSLNNLKNFIAGIADIDASGISLFNATIVSLGMAYRTFSSSSTSVKPELVEIAIASLNKIKDFINSLVALDISGITTFQQAMTQLGTTSIDGFIEAFAGAGVRIATAVTGLFATLNISISSNTSMIVSTFSKMINMSVSSILSKSIAFVTAGIQIMNNLVNGINSQTGKLVNLFTNSLNKTANSIRHQQEQFKSSGVLLVQGLINGIKSYTGNIKESFTSSVSETVTSIRGYYSSFHSVGGYLAQGFAEGINSNAFKAKVAAKAMAEAAAEAARRALDINSPSKVLYEIGRFAVAGFANALHHGVNTVYIAGKEMVSASIDGLSNSISKISDLISGDIDTQPTIRPVIDLSSVQSGVSALNSMVDQGITAKRTLMLASSAGVTINQNALVVERLNDAFNSTVNKILSKFEGEESSKTYVLESPVIINGREVAKASAKYTQAELNKLEKTTARKGGKR